MTALPPWLAGLSPDADVLLLTLGVALMYYECNRPGSILPGAVGLLTALLSLAAIGQQGLNPLASLLILSAVVLLALGLVRPTPMPISVVATVALVLGLRWLPAYNCCHAVHTPVAAGCGTTLGAGTWALSGIARRARINKTVHKGLDS